MPEHPVATLKEALPELRRPFAPAAVKWKIQTSVRNGAAGIVVAHIDARLVIERLNLVVAHAWADQYDEFAGAMRCRLWICSQVREDVGLGPDPKSRVSDALKRAGVKFGIGVSIYALSSVYMEVGAGASKLGVRENKAKNTRSPELTAENREWLADRYGAWLETDRGKGFGEPLDHGDDDGAQGLDDEGAPTELPELDEGSPAAEDAREAALRKAREKAS